jgi:hypothetical protein
MAAGELFSPWRSTASAGSMMNAPMAASAATFMLSS